MTPFQQYIRSHVQMSHATSTGYHTLVCAVCQDHKKRAGFSFLPDGGIVYNCFRGRCTASCAFAADKPLSFKFKRVLSAFGLTIPDEILMQLPQFEPKTRTTPLNKELYIPHGWRGMTVPPELVPYDENVHANVRQYLAKRDIQDHDYFVHPRVSDWFYAPLRFYDDIIGFQSICMRIKRYQNITENTDVLYLPDGNIPAEPIIVEGIMDAKSVPNGVASIHAGISPRQAYMLRNTRPILLPDKEGSRYLDVARRYGWRLSLPDWHEKDCNKAMLKYGRLLLAQKVKDAIMDYSETTEMQYNLWTAPA